MFDEHFGINIVEYTAPGLIPVTHACEGPFLDFGVPVSGKRTGFHCTSVAECAEAFYEVFSMDQGQEVETLGPEWTERMVDGLVGSRVGEEIVDGWNIRRSTMREDKVRAAELPKLVPGSE